MSARVATVSGRSLNLTSGDPWYFVNTPSLAESPEMTPYLQHVMNANLRFFEHLKEEGPTYYVTSNDLQYDADIIVHETYTMIEQTRSTAGAEIFVDVRKPFPVPIDGGHFLARGDTYYVQRVVEEDETQYVVQVTK